MEAARTQSPADIGKLKRLLFAPEQARIDALQSQCESFAQKIGDDARFEQTTAQVIAGALRRAEIERHRELSSAIAPLVVAAIRSEIVNSRDMMVDALYPITGRLVAAAVANAFRDLAESLEKRIDSLLSGQMWKLRLRAWLTRRPLSEVLLEAARRPQVVRLLALERDTGRLLASWRADGQADDSAELVSGLIAAISQFSAQAFAREHGELRQLDMGPSHLLLRASARMLVAAEFSGVPDAADERRMDGALFDLIGSAQPLDTQDLARIAQTFSAPAAPPPSAAARYVLAGLVVAALAGALYLPVSDAIRSRRIDAAFAAARSAQNLSGWPLDVSRESDKLVVRGLAPPDADLDALANSLAPAAAPETVELRVTRLGGDTGAMTHVATLEARAAQTHTAFEARLAHAESALSQTESTLAKTQTALAAAESWRAERDAKENAPAARLARLAAASQIVFADETRLKAPEQARATVAALAEALKAGGRLRVIGYTDSTGNADKNHALSLARAVAVTKLLTEAGAPADRLVAVGRGDEHAVTDRGGDARADNRRVAFETLEPVR
ncbi:outer membrane protein OmpA-like peptidoglycan-associated protein [Rhodoblastus acidophilus]|uniref:OmpA family protein n=1 Tax=Rhodoblastus acidophilus TaxID=1074 RepID=UPI002223FC9B|nr:OmpA family protein [Rhodoblastus acidophilus]MCW2317008.1 outer membrane protein OmpA-like peptidoglycan-associated protein [Rhodoblastus acidophilus]